MSSIHNPTLPANNSSICYWNNVSGCAATIAICNAASKVDAPILMLCESNEVVERSIRELEYFAQGVENLPVFSLPNWETLPYDSFSPHQDIISQRLSALYQLPKLTRGILVLSISSLMHRLAPHQYIVANSLDLQVGQILEIQGMKKQLVLAGYQSVDSVFEHGEFAIRGSIIDIFPMGSIFPYRIDLFDDEIESLRTFNPETQRSIEKVNKIKLLPAREYPLNEQGISAFRNKFHEFFNVDPRQCPFYQDVSDGIHSPGLEYYLSLFHESLDSLFDYMPPNTIIVKLGNLKETGEKFWLDVENRYKDKLVDKYRPVLTPDKVFIGIDEALSLLKNYRQIELKTHNNAIDYDAFALPNLATNNRLANPFSALVEFLTKNDVRILFCTESPGRRETLTETLKNIGINPTAINHIDKFFESDETLGITVAPIDQATWLYREKIALITETQLFDGRVAQRRRRNSPEINTDFIVKNLTELRIDDPVVHVDHGVGRYRGLKTITTDNEPAEFLVLEYANETKLYIPITSLNLISRYSGANEATAPLNHLGSDSWNKAKRKAAEKIYDVAAELLDIYSIRAAQKGYEHTLPKIDYDKFSASFKFEETADQESTINAVIDDMCSEKTMDRLVCGDVGFGKTEVAMRAAFIAVQNNKQVVILVPTTLLAQQHFESFKDRFADWPITVDVVSRFKSAAEQKDSFQNVVNGKTDVLIGTHKLLHSNIEYNNLGLLIVDEEHRFGVRQKAKINSLRANVDILTLTATPIPRTLNMALSGIRDLSLIVTPPAKRLSIKTFVREQQDSLIKEAVSREILRGGQVFYLHNEVKTIERSAQQLEELVPEARICVAHGQMAERDLERVMTDFYHKKYNILVCTTIIETGIDIPTANTIVINRADKFGLAQLHQLRGRVGRSHHQAYAYLLLPNHKLLSSDAKKRIEAIKSADSLGAGFNLASNDLEIRGAGELLGDEQSGHLQKIGFSLYTEMLEEAVEALKKGKSPRRDLDLDKSIELNLRIPALIPETYLPDVHNRLIMYKRISSSKSKGELRELQVEMIDRFGLLPEPLKRLFNLTQLKIKAKKFGIKKIDANVSAGRIEFKKKTNVDPLSIVDLVQNDPTHYKLIDANQLNFSHDNSSADEKLNFITDILNKLKLIEQNTA
ncbi:MAG: transcription-repair coupling factor [Gammaproteobacteria bacterium]|nr:transcription-repair coupling factor [Gammaproteobacteria bacterium]